MDYAVTDSAKLPDAEVIYTLVDTALTFCLGPILFLEGRGGLSMDLLGTGFQTWHEN
jgi:hypothetical protein